MTGPLYRVGRVCSRHHWVVIGLWVIAAIALLATSRAAGEDTSDKSSRSSRPGPWSGDSRRQVE